jgi:hypothetical protein
MAVTYELIETVTVTAGAGAANITFTSIPQTYTDLQLVMSVRTNRSSAADYVAVSFNSSTSSFSTRLLFGTGSVAGTASHTVSPDSRIAGQAVGNNATANIFSNGYLYIPNYTSSNNKSYSYDAAREDNASGTELGIGAGLWSDTAAITSIAITSWGGSTILQYSSASLYGIKNS